MKKYIALILAILMLATCFAGCKQEKTIVVGYTVYEPMNYEDENGKLVGFDTELAEAVFKKLGYKVVFKLIEWDNKYTDLNSDTIQCIWKASPPTKPMTTAFSALTRSTSPITTWKTVR